MALHYWNPFRKRDLGSGTVKFFSYQNCHHDNWEYIEICHVSSKPIYFSLMYILNSQMVTSTHMILLTRKKERMKGKQEEKKKKEGRKRERRN